MAKDLAEMVVPSVEILEDKLTMLAEARDRIDVFRTPDIIEFRNWLVNEVAKHFKVEEPIIEHEGKRK